MPHVGRHRLKDTDAVARVDTLRAIVWMAPAVFIILALAEFKAVGAGPTFFWLLLLNVPLIAALIFVLLRVTQGIAAAWSRLVLAGGDIPPAPSFSYEESLVIRGRPDEAADAFRAHLETHPDDLDARLALADVLRLHLGDPAGAERQYLEVRAGKPNPRQEALASNQLIDLYHATGQRGRLLVELARFADRYPETRAGREARRRLEGMKAGGDAVG